MPVLCCTCIYVSTYACGTCIKYVVHSRDTHDFLKPFGHTTSSLWKWAHILKRDGTAKATYTTCTLSWKLLRISLSLEINLKLKNGYLPKLIKSYNLSPPSHFCQVFILDWQKSKVKLMKTIFQLACFLFADYPRSSCEWQSSRVFKVTNI